MTQDILKVAIEKLESTKDEITGKIKSYEEEIVRYRESNKELLDEMSIEVNSPEIDKELKKLRNCEDYKREIDDMIWGIKNQKNLIKMISEYNINFGDLEAFFNLAMEIKGYNISDIYDFCTKLSKQVMVKVPVKTSDFEKFNTLRGVVLLKIDTMRDENMFYGSINVMDKKRMVAQEVKKTFSDPSIDVFFDKLVRYFESSIKEINSISKESGERIQKIREQEIRKRKEEIVSNVDELNKKIEECRESLESIERIYELYEEYKESEDHEILIRLIGQLTDLAIIGQRESKLITYQSTEKEEKVEETEKTPLEEKKEVYTVVPPKELSDPLYYKDPNTQNIICFLGKEDDDIFTDINDHFDYSNRPYLVSELVELFNTLYVNADYENKTGGNPKYFSSSKVRSYREKLGFNYKRFGVGSAQYRIHAITRDSALLKELGYGTGRITFFGALGVNDNKEKTGAYDRMARRGIESTGNTLKLQPSFDYIEHITRSYIPFELLSEADKNREYFGMFNGNVKGTDTKKAIENFRYLYYYILDDKSKANVKEWLDKYFMKQSDKLFEVIGEHNTNEKKKKGTLD